MAKRINERERLAFKLDSLTDIEVKEVLEYISIMESMRRASIRPGQWEDELIALLADSLENKRARQTFEWENIRRRSERRSVATVVAAAARA